MLRRRLLIGFGQAILAGLWGCRPRDKAGAADSAAPPSTGVGGDDAAPAPLPLVCPNEATAPAEDPPAAGWVDISLADHPTLATVGGSVVISVPEALLEVIVAQTHPDCFVAVWRVCTHGACELSWEPSRSSAVCPCHGSRFGPDGAVLVGPATRPIRAFPVARRGDRLWIDARR